MKLLLLFILAMAALGLLSIAMQGCTFVRGDSSISVMQLAPGDDVQSRTATIVGIEAAPFGIDGPVLRLGYVKSQQSRVPSYDAESTTPFVLMETVVDGHGAAVKESLQVNDEPPPQPKGWFQ